MRRALLLVFVTVTIAATSSAQTFRGGISGIITDQTGTIVPEAAVKATSEATGLVYATTASSAGEFAFADCATWIFHPYNQRRARIGWIHL